MLNGEKIPCFHNTNEAPPGCCRIALTENVQVPPGCEMIVKGRPLDRFNKDGIGIVETSDTLLQNMACWSLKLLSAQEGEQYPCEL